MADFDGTRPFITTRFNVVLTSAAFICGFLDWVTDPIYEKAPSRIARGFTDAPMIGVILTIFLVAVSIAITVYIIHQFWLRFAVARFNLRPITLAEAYAIATIAWML